MPSIIARNTVWRERTQMKAALAEERAAIRAERAQGEAAERERAAAVDAARAVEQAAADLDRSRGFFRGRSIDSTQPFMAIAHELAALRADVADIQGRLRAVEVPSYIDIEHDATPVTKKQGRR